jgi:hypothetical protein
MDFITMRLSPMFSGTSNQKAGNAGFKKPPLPAKSTAPNTANQGNDSFDPTKTVQSDAYYERFNPVPQNKPFSIASILSHIVREPIRMQPIEGNASYRNKPGFDPEKTIQSDAYYKSLYGE